MVFYLKELKETYLFPEATGPAVDELKEKPLAAQTVLDVYKGKKTTNHMENFLEV